MFVAGFRSRWSGGVVGHGDDGRGDAGGGVLRGGVAEAAGGFGLSVTVPVPVEVVAFGWETTAARLTELGGNPVLRKAADGVAFRTDGGNLILDYHVGAIADPARLEQDLSRTIGVVETGLFIGMATTALVASKGGIIRLDR